jgi:hypothetical protein
VSVEPVYMCERGGGGRGGVGLRHTISVVIMTYLDTSVSRTWEDFDRLG